MSFDAGEVYAVLGAKVAPEGFVAYDAAIKKSTAEAETFEKRVIAATERVAAATEKSAAMQAAAYEAASKREAAAADRAAAQRAAAAERAAAREKAAAERAAAAVTAAQQREAAKQTAIAEREAAKQQAIQDRAIAKQQAKTAAANKRFVTGVKYGAAAGIAAVGFALFESVKKAADFEQTLNVLQATSNATDAQMVKVRRTAVALGNDMSLPATSAKDAADAMTELAKGGLTVTQTMAAAKGVLQLSAAAQISNADAAIIVADNLNAFNLKAHESVRVADLLAAAANATTASIPEMGDALKQSAASAHQLGIPIQDLVTLLGDLANRGIKGSDAGTSVKTMLQSLIPNSKQAAEEMKRLNVSAFDQAGKFRGMPAIIDQYHRALGKLTQEQQASALKTIFGSDAVRAASIIFGQSGQQFDSLRSKMTKHGAAADLAKAQTKGFNGAMEALKSNVDTIAISIGSKLLPSLTDAARGTAGFLSDLQAGKGAGAEIAADIETLAHALVQVDHATGFTHGIGDELHGLEQVVAGSVHVVAALLRGDLSGAFRGLGTVVSGAMRAVTAPIRALGASVDPLIGHPFRAAADAILGAFSSILTGAASVVGVMSRIPGVGGAFKGLAGDIKDAADSIDHLRDQIRGVKPVKISAEASQARAILADIRGTKLGTKVMKVLGDKKDADGKIKELIALGIPAKKARVLAAVADALNGISTVDGAMRRLDGFVATATIRIQQQGTAGIPSLTPRPQTSRNPTGSAPTRAPTGPNSPGRRAAGRGPGGAETALVGEGRVAREAVVDPASGMATIVNGPTIMNLSPSAYVIPEDPMQRGRSMGLLRMLAEDLGLRGFAHSKKPAKRAKRFVPPKLDPLAFDVSSFQSKEQDAKSALDKAKAIVGREPGLIKTTQAQIRDIQRRKPKNAAQRANKADDLKRAKAKLAEREKALGAARREETQQRAIWKERLAELRQAQKYASQLQRLTDAADTAGNEMALADRNNDEGAYQGARGRRGQALKARRDLLARAQALAAAAGSADYASALGTQISQLDVDQASNDDATQGGTGDTEADRIAQTGMTDAERGALSDINRDVALAALTKGLEDDKTAAGRLVDFLTGVLNRDVSNGTAADVVTDLAGQVKQARDNLASLTSGGGTNSDQDLQAQIDQANERTRVASAEAATNAQALAVLAGAGDIGVGGPNAAGAARGVTVHQTINTLHPGDPRTKIAIADAAATGFGLQPRISSKIVRLGV